MRKLVIALAAVCGLVAAAPAFAANGPVTLVSDFSDASTENDIAKVTFSVPAGLKFKDIETLSAEFNVTDDDCGGGSPRFTLVTARGNIFVHFGPSPSFTGCTQNTWLGTGNLIGNADAGRYGVGQLGGSASTTYAEALAVAGEDVVTSVELNVDGGWSQADKEQTVSFRNVVIDGATELTTGINPAQTCKALRASMGVEAFRNTYGTNRNKRNAFGKCVSSTARMKAAERREVANAAIACKAERSEDAAAFRQRYGAARNGLGRCVSSKTGTNPVAAANRGQGRRP